MIIPRAVDDGSLAGLQFPLWQYHQDHFLTSPAENDTQGLIIQTTHIRGNEHSMRFLAEGMWNPSLTPEHFYADYAKRLFGKEAAPIIEEAFEVLEGNDEYLGSRCLRQFLENILAFYEGREYWGKVDWDIMFGHCPFPTYQMDEVSTSEQRHGYEPG